MSPVGHSTVRGEARLKFCWVPWHRALKSPLCHVGVPSEQHDFIMIDYPEGKHIYIIKDAGNSPGFSYPK